MGELSYYAWQESTDGHDAHVQEWRWQREHAPKNSASCYNLGIKFLGFGRLKAKWNAIHKKEKP